MIQLERIRTKHAVVASFRGAKPVERLAGLMTARRDKLAAGQDPKLKFASRWSVTKKQLIWETQDKCAYCESHTTAVAFGDVEHYRPKSVYWWLAYVYDNYLASCSICNQQFKSNAFEFTGPRMAEPPIAAGTTDARIDALSRTTVPDPLDAAAVAAYEIAHRAEAPLIPNPYIDDPERFFAWDVLDGAKEVELVPNESEPDAAAIVAACERIYGLNRAQLKRRRFKWWRSYRGSVVVVEDAAAAAATRDLHQEFLDLMGKADSEYAAMIRFFEKRRLSA